MADAEGTESRNQPVHAVRRIIRRRFFAASILIVASILVSLFAIIETPLSIESASITNMGPQIAYATFEGIGEYYVHAECFNVNATRSCPLLATMAFGTPDGALHDNFCTRSITLKAVNSLGTTLALEVDEYTTPPTEYRVAYGLDQPWSPSVTVTVPNNAPGSTWTFKIIVSNPPILNGKMALQIVGESQVVDNHLLGRTYNLQTGVMQLTGYS